jgi:hypothetical protein
MTVHHLDGVHELRERNLLVYAEIVTDQAQLPPVQFLFWAALRGDGNDQIRLVPLVDGQISRAQPKIDQYSASQLRPKCVLVRQHRNLACPHMHASRLTEVPVFQAIRAPLTPRCG